MTSEEAKSGYFKLGFAAATEHPETVNGNLLIKVLTSGDADPQIKSYIMYCIDHERQKGNVPEQVYSLLLAMTGLKTRKLSECEARALEDNQDFCRKLQSFSKEVITLPNRHS